MANPKDDLSRVTINQIEKLTGSNYRRIVKILSDSGIQSVGKDGNAIYYDPKKALPAVFESMGYRTRQQSPIPDDVDDEEVAKLLDLQIQNARLAREKTRKLMIEIDILSGKYVLSTDVERVWSNIVIAAKAKLRSIPGRMAPHLIKKEDPIEIEATLDKEINEALEDLSAQDAGELYSDDGGGDDQVGTSTEVDD
ncbi:MAG: hypothetical protein AAGB31_12200 [Bdellovibrio sp.]